MARCYIGLGSNTGDRVGYLRSAVGELKAMLDVEVRKVSSIFETEPVGRKDQPDFLNAVAEIRTELPPAVLLERLKHVELRLGRTASERWGPREIDLDLLFWGDQMLTGPPVDVPHPEAWRRRFVLAPLAEISPLVTDPRTGKRFIDLLQACPGQERVSVIQESV
ncbi:MAG: 2-amino-4-hydroxy-6-hydroxymethyldihydropteridine diphosphokinase [Bacteroidetes bacterium]|jgi:2-amino-4-hydroxy-6-hydroxymethyldihydropteridine diphosphokinase|nr:2-amino-4-hydroxy-6-hydroxymethyldihydropteridine diphosphokinase [Bacteroidota bacterium]